MKLIVNPHKIEIDKSPVNEREIDITKCEFEFADEITNDYVKEAYFTFGGTSYKKIIVNNQCAIPSEVLAKKGQVEIGVVAFLVEDEEEIKRYNPSPAYFNTWLGSLKDNAENSEPITPSEMEQYEQALNDGLAEVNDKLDEIDQALDDVTTAITETNNLDLDVSKKGKTATVTLTKKDATTKTVTLSDGTSLMFNWDGTRLGIKTDEDDEYVYVDLQGIQGPIGPKGEAFTIKKTYSSVAEMNADFNNMQLGDYVMIASTVELEDNAKLYTRGEEQWIFISDFSGATGVKGETGATPNIQIGTVTSGSTPSVTRSGTNENPILNFVLVKGDKGDTGQTGATGATGNGIASITKTGTQDTVDTYTILYTDGTTSTFTVTNGEVSQAQLDVVKTDLERYKTLSKLFPKVEGEGSNITLNNTVEGVMLETNLKGNTEQAITTGKNVFNKVDYTTISTSNNQSPSNVTKTKNSISFTSNPNNNYSGIYISYTNLLNYIDNFDSDTTYYISMDITTDTACTFYYGAASFGDAVDLTVGTQRLVKSEKITANFVLYVRAAEAKIKIENIMISTSSDTTYESYTRGVPAPAPQIYIVTGNQNIKIGNTNYSLSLGEMQLCEGDYIYRDNETGNWYKYGLIKKAVLNGSETWQLRANDGTNFCYSMTAITDYLFNLEKAYASYFPSETVIGGYSQALSKGYGLWFYGANTTTSTRSLYMVINNIASVSTLQSWLSTHNVTLYYPLAEPIITQITDTTLITELNNLYNAVATQGTTFIVCTSLDDNNVPLIVKASTYKDISSILNPTETVQSL